MGSNIALNRRANGGKMKHADEASPVEEIVIREAPFCAWCGGTCTCEDYDDEPESEFCECGLEHGEEELAANACACCGGIIDV